MREEKYRFAYEEANADLREIVSQFEELRRRKDQLESVLAALRPFVGMEAAPATLAAVSTPEPERQAPEPTVYSYLQVGKTVEPASSESNRIMAKTQLAGEPAPESMAMASESSDPFQRRIDDALWGWRRPATLMSTT